MKKLNFIFLFFVCFSKLYSNQAIEIGTIEIGHDDGGEYCFRIPGIAGGMFANFERAGDRPGAAPCTCTVPLQDFEMPDYWNNKAMNFEEVRSFFPIFQSTVNNHTFIFFDSGATAQMPQQVMDEMVKYYQEYKSNVGRGLYEYAERATHMFEAARTKIARFIGAQKDEIVFTAGTTSGINLVAQIWASCHLQEGDEIVISEVEHNANFIPWQQLCQRKKAAIKIVPLTDEGVVDVQALKNTVSSKTKLVAVTHQSNILGTSNDIASICKISHEVGAKVLVDAAQSVVHQKIDVAAIDCDFLVFSAHKLYGPTGVGVLFVKQELFSECMLVNFGGGSVMEVTLDHTQFKKFPHCLEPGTQAIAQVIGLGAAVEFVQKNINFAQVQEHETKLVCRLAHALEKIPGIKLVSPIPKQGMHSNLVTFITDRCHAYDVAEFLSEHGIAVRAGYHCAQPYHDKHTQGISSVRVSLAVYNTQQEVDYLIDCLKSFFKN